MGSVPAGSVTEVVAPRATSGLVRGVVSAMAAASGPAPGVDSVTAGVTVTEAVAAHPVPAGTAVTRVAIATAAAAMEGAAVAAAAADGSVRVLRLGVAEDTKLDVY